MGAAEQTATREDVLDLLGRTRFDLLVIGGGIIGCAVAWLGARAPACASPWWSGGDLAGQTSSASSKLIHGGLRYLQMGDIGLVREAHAERHALARTVAPHLVRPRAFLVPVYRGGPVRATTLRAGLVLYGGLGRFADGGGSLLRPPAARALVPPLRTAGLRSAGRYVDHETNDARLTIAVARAAARAGAAVATRVEVQALRKTGGRITGADCVAVSEGAAFGHRRDLRRQRDGALGRRDPAHGRPGRAALAAVRQGRARGRAAGRAVGRRPDDAARGRRVQFANPWEGALLVGTTDEPYDGDPRDIAASEADVAQIVRESRASIEPGVVEHDRILSSFAGVRVLPQGEGETPSARRETVFERGADGLLSIAGGKFTTFRRIALDALERLRGDLGLRTLDRTPAALPGASDPGVVVERLLRDHPSLAAGERAASRALPRQ